MRRLLPLAVLALALAGCGGTDIGGNPGNIYVGKWTGTWSDALRSDSGTIEFTVAANGTYTGKISRTVALAATSDTSGTVQQNGDFNLVAVFTSSNFTNVTGTFFRSGNAITGSFQYTFNGSSSTGTFTMGPGS